MAKQENTSVSVIGLGRVGLMTLFHLAEKDFFPYGMDIDKELIHQLKTQKAPFVEPEFDKLLEKYHTRITFSTVFPDTKYNFISVPTSFENQTGAMNLKSIVSVLKQIEKSSYSGKYVFIRSTLNPGSCKKLSDQFKNLSISYFPEFFREGHFVKDYRSAKFSVLGSLEMEDILSHFDYFQFSNVEYSTSEEAELLKVLCNLFHAFKVSFANEAGRLAKAFHSSPHRIMELFVRDKKLNISKAYLKPGFSFGGPCLTKDIQSLNSNPISDQILIPKCVETSNQIHTEWTAKQILNLKPKTISVLGCSFTGGQTIDYRGSSVLRLIEILSRQKKIKIYGVEKILKSYPCTILPKSSPKKLYDSDIFILGGWSPLFNKYSSLFSIYQGILFDLLIQDLPDHIKNHPNYTDLYSQ